MYLIHTTIRSDGILQANTIYLLPKLRASTLPTFVHHHTGDPRQRNNENMYCLLMKATLLNIWVKMNGPFKSPFEHRNILKILLELASIAEDLYKNAIVFMVTKTLEIETFIIVFIIPSNVHKFSFFPPILSSFLFEGLSLGLYEVSTLHPSLLYLLF